MQKKKKTTEDSPVEILVLGEQIISLAANN